MITQGTGPALQLMVLGLTLIPAPEKVKPHKVRSRKALQHDLFRLLSLTSKQFTPSADNTSQDRKNTAVSTQGSVALCNAT